MSLSKSSVLLPLYVYPLTPETWAPLYEAIEQNPQLPFTVIINPNSGPGVDTSRPDDRYCREISKLNTFANVTLVGYVRIDYCKRDVTKALREIDVYGGWAGLKADGSEDHAYIAPVESNGYADGNVNGASDQAATQNGTAKPPLKAKPWHLKTLQVIRDKSPFRRDRSKSPSPSPSRLASPHGGNAARGREYSGSASAIAGKGASNSPAKSTPQIQINDHDSPRRPLSMQGIFFDETPNIHDASKEEFMHSITRAVKTASGIGGQKLVIHNPGTMPDAELVDPRLPSNRSRCLADVTACFEATYAEYMAPSEWTRNQMAKCKLERSRKANFVHSVPTDRVKEVTMRLRGDAEYVFVTDLKEGFYCSFDRSWTEFVKAMAL